ncbi:hypothetical protein [Sphaerospermopsis torques-reginae]|uniref:hypothetical protein n=1 Tax=Sphaerospermopsis torques-reginae TaxID=984207 RepID=UPI001FE9EB71|nr:hypothetical protein [Sphaerospermopsis torques-reginae]
MGLSLSLTLGFTPSFALALEYKSQLDLSQSVDSVEGENIFYTKAMQLVQQQIYLIARLEQALSSSDPNRMRSVRGQLTVYTLDSQEKQIYAQFLQLPNTGIFRVLPDSAYRRRPNTLQNRLQPSVIERYPFPSVGEGKGDFTPSVALKMIDDNFQLFPQGIDYGFIVNIGDVPLEKLDGRLQTLDPSTRDFFLNYQPPRELKAL